ncbi:MAG: DUF1428 domain-containing protein [Pseudohongiellaceae bacterium]
MSYVDVFLIPITGNRVDDYRPLAELSEKVWREHGAQNYEEYLFDEHTMEQHTSPNSFTAAAGAKEGEAVVLAVITYPSKAEREAVLKKAVNDPRLASMMDGDVPFDDKRMIFGGFKSLFE